MADGRLGRRKTSFGLSWADVSAHGALFMKTFPQNPEEQRRRSAPAASELCENDTAVNGGFVRCFFLWLKARTKRSKISGEASGKKNGNRSAEQFGRHPGGKAAAAGLGGGKAPGAERGGNGGGRQTHSGEGAGTARIPGGPDRDGLCEPAGRTGHPGNHSGCCGTRKTGAAAPMPGCGADGGGPVHRV